MRTVRFSVTSTVGLILVILSTGCIVYPSQLAKAQIFGEDIAGNTSSSLLDGQGNGTSHISSTEDMNTTATTTTNSSSPAAAEGQVWNLTEQEAKEIIDNAAEAYEEITNNNITIGAIAHLENIIRLVTGGSSNTSKMISEIIAKNRDGSNTNSTELSSSTSIAGQQVEQRSTVLPASSSYLHVKHSMIPQIMPVQIQQQQQQENQTLPGQQTIVDQSTNQFRITFEKLHVNVNHDPIFEGEWIMDAYVNRQRVPLFSGFLSVEDGETVNLTQGNSIVLTVQEDGGHIWIVTAGWENDVGVEAAPNVGPIFRTEGEGQEAEQQPTEGIVEEENLEVRDAGEFGIDSEIYERGITDETERATDRPNLTFDEYVTAVQETIAYHTGYGNDALGYIKKQFTAADNFGIGQHRICSEPNQFAGEGGANNNSTTACDFELEFRIEELN